MLTLIRIGTVDVMAYLLIALSVFSGYTSYALGFDNLPAVLAFAVSLASLPMLSMYGSLCTGFGKFFARAYMILVGTAGMFAGFFCVFASIAFFWTLAATGVDLIFDGEWDVVSGVLFYALPMVYATYKVVTRWMPNLT